MRTNIADKQPVALFFFAHQDDEYGVYKTISDELSQGHRVISVYYTDGGFSGVSSQRRNQESLNVLSRLGISGNDVLFVGESLSIPDGKLIHNMALAGRWLDDWLPTFSSITSIYVPAWEGGHHDHDALHALVILAAQRHDLLPKVRQFSLYNAYNRFHPFFRVKSPLRENGPVVSSKIGWNDRFKYLRFCASYPSQAITWIGLFPFVLWHYLFNGSQALQPVDVARLDERPHSGSLYYERRRFCTWEIMQSNIGEYRRTRYQTRV
ncbi:PIG-L deacetylase family protein [Achromobacter sp. UBA2119]|uniref:PIG-L deacetylase family protein n=1 Tax=Achromobacter sp. UBA2119 TaxID=1945911 RepID=UPI00257B1713|nr:PIG-L family deacetylase [Achromobacter sp. UBA2119]